MVKYFIILGLSASISLSQQGTYKKKSISSLETVWIKPGALKNIKKVDFDILNSFIEFYIEIPRFDFNTLPKSQIQAFINEANKLSVVDTKTLSKVMEDTIIEEILSILNDPRVQSQRGQKLKNESDFKSFASTKAKSIGLTTKQLGSLMNSAFIYLPYINKMESEKEKGTLSIKIEGGIIWWRMKVKENGTAFLEKIYDATISADNSIDLNLKDSKGKKYTYSEYTWGDRKFETNPETYVQGDAMAEFIQNLSIKMREIPEFKLQAQVEERIGRRYGFRLGLEEGVHLDDGFFLIELEEDEKGNEKEVNLGFLRVSKSRKKSNSLTALSTAKQIYGKKGDIGSIMVEHPRLGIESKFKLSVKSGLNIEPDHAFNLIEETAKNSLILGYGMSYNLAPIINLSQTFLDVEFAFGLLNAKLTDEAIDDRVIPYTIGLGVGLSKKFWFGRMNFPVGLLYNIEGLTFHSKEEELSFSSSGGKLNTGLEYMINANTIISFGIEYTVIPEISSVTFENEDEEEIDLSKELGDDFLDFWNKGGVGYFGNDPLSLSGLSIRFGIDRSLGGTEGNIFGSLDRFKKY